MTRLDRAFIKAYSKSTAAPPSPHLGPAAGVAPSQSSPTDKEARGPIGQVEPDAPAAWFTRGGEAARSDEGHALSVPHWIVSETSTFTTWDVERELTSESPQGESTVERPVAPAAPHEMLIAPVADVATVSRPMTQNRIDPADASMTSETSAAPPTDSASSAKQAGTQSCRAAFEVDSLMWPEVNYSLAAACRRQWEQLMKELIQSSHEGQKVYLVSSYARGEGRTSLVLCLAQLLSQKQKRVAVVDADFQRPQIARQLKLLPACGWDEVVRDKQPLTEAWIESVGDGVTLLPLDKRADGAGLTGNPRLKQMFEALRSQHDIVLIDAGAVSDSNDRETLALLAGTAQVDSAVLVRDVRSTSWDTLHDSQKCLDAIGIARWDVVENFAD